MLRIATIAAAITGAALLGACSSFPASKGCTNGVCENAPAYRIDRNATGENSGPTGNDNAQGDAGAGNAGE